MKLLVLLLLCPAALALDLASATGRDIMAAVYARHQQYPFVYEEQSMVLIDRRGHRETRKLRRYSRAEEDGSINLLLLFDSPVDVTGVAMLARRSSTGEVSQSVYLPGLGGEFVKNGDDCEVVCGDNFLGTDFSVESLTGESLDDYRYDRQIDLQMADADYYVIDVFHDSSGEPLRRHYILQESLFISRTDHLNDLGKVRKRQTHHDLNPVHGDMWRANMMLMENRVDNHRTVIKVDRRVFSADYVPMEVFTQTWLRENHPPLEEDKESAPEASSELEMPSVNTGVTDDNDGVSRS